MLFSTVLRMNLNEGNFSSSEPQYKTTSLKQAVPPAPFASRIPQESISDVRLTMAAYKLDKAVGHSARSSFCVSPTDVWVSFALQCLFLGFVH